MYILGHQLAGRGGGEPGCVSWQRGDADGPREAVHDNYACSIM
jgi:hypothetical protein